MFLTAFKTITSPMKKMGLSPEEGIFTHRNVEFLISFDLFVKVLQLLMDSVASNGLRQAWDPSKEN